MTTQSGKLTAVGYSLAMKRGAIAFLWSRIFYRRYCPYPIIADHRAKACIAAGLCGCDNRPTTEGER